MTIQKVIKLVEDSKGYTDTNKILMWLTKIDGVIKKEIIDTHENGESVVFNGYNEETPGETELLVKPPYDDIYIPWLESRIDLANGEYAKYNNGVAIFNSTYTEFARYYNRTNKPKGEKFKFI